MLDLNVIREQIDGIDKQLVDLFEQRMKLTKEVAEYKIQTGKKVLDTQRERAKIEAVTKLVKNEANVHAIDDLFSQIMANSRKGQYQLLEAMGQTLREPYEAIESINKEGVKIVYQGVPGAYTQEAACNSMGRTVIIMVFLPGETLWKQLRIRKLIMVCFQLRILQREVL